jgi:hypothetical protein
LIFSGIGVYWLNSAVIVIGDVAVRFTAILEESPFAMIVNSRMRRISKELRNICTSTPRPQSMKCPGNWI